MSYWKAGALSGYDATPIEVAGLVVGKKPGWILFHDGIAKRWLPKEHIIRYDKQRHSVTIPQWLMRRRRFYNAKANDVR